MEPSSPQSNRQGGKTPGEIYEQYRVPAIFSVWVPALVSLLSLERGQSVLDVACGTGAVTRHVMSQVGSEGHVIGLDINPNMLDMARQTEPAIEWHQGNAEELPFKDREFDAVVCQQGLQFVPDKPQALREMLRVLKPGGRLALATWCTIETSPGHHALAQGIERHISQEVASLMYSPFSLGSAETIVELLATAGFRETKIRQEERLAQFLSMDDFTAYELMGSALGRSGVTVSDEALTAILDDVNVALQPYLHSDGLRFPMQAHLVRATK